jgi:hypothetical protein
MGVTPTGPEPPEHRLPPADLTPWPSLQLKSTLTGIELAMANVPDAIAQPSAENASFLTQVAFIPNLLPKMENQSFEKLLPVRETLFASGFVPSATSRLLLTALPG